MIIALDKLPISDTVTVTADGRTVVDAEKLFAKPHIQKMIREIKAKTRIISAKRDKPKDLVTA